MSDDLVKESDCFRLGTRPNDDDVHHANWIIDRQTARIEELEAENARPDVLMSHLALQLRQDGYLVPYVVLMRAFQKAARVALQDKGEA